MPHPFDAIILGDLPNVVIDEEGFEVAAFRFFRDAESFIGTPACHIAGYSIRGRTANRPKPDCQEIRQSDELFCPPCGLRWDAAEERPDCPRKAHT